jgi:hypothetical protein
MLFMTYLGVPSIHGTEASRERYALSLSRPEWIMAD